MGATYNSYMTNVEETGNQMDCQVKGDEKNPHRDRATKRKDHQTFLRFFIVGNKDEKKAERGSPTSRV